MFPETWNIWQQMNTCLWVFAGKEGHENIFLQPALGYHSDSISNPRKTPTDFIRVVILTQSFTCMGLGHLQRLTDLLETTECAFILIKPNTCNPGDHVWRIWQSSCLKMAHQTSPWTLQPLIVKRPITRTPGAEVTVWISQGQRKLSENTKGEETGCSEISFQDSGHGLQNKNKAAKENSVFTMNKSLINY